MSPSPEHVKSLAGRIFTTVLAFSLGILLAFSAVMVSIFYYSYEHDAEQALVQEAISTLLTGRTSFLIAHRLSTIRKADLILVVRAGKIIERGTHQELMALGGYYADLYNKQFETESAETVFNG